jgi:hypothetical protein
MMMDSSGASHWMRLVDAERVPLHLPHDRGENLTTKALGAVII